jgi:predicted dehydrogenase
MVSDLVISALAKIPKATTVYKLPCNFLCVNTDKFSLGTLTTIEGGKPGLETHPTTEPPTYVEYYRVLAKALRGEGNVPVSPQDARDVLRIVEAAIQSSREGRSVDLS